MTGLPLFDLAEGLKRRDAGMDSLEAQDSFVRIVRAAMIERSQLYGSASSDDAREWAEDRGLRAPHPNCWGSIFRPTRSGHWIEIGREPSKFARNNARRISRWRFVPNPEAH